MNRNKRSFVGLLLIGLSLASSGCIDAVRTGIATGINDGLAAVVQGIVEAVLGNVAVEE